MATFVAEEGTLKGLILSFEEGERWIIGRDPEESNLLLEDPKVSRKHLLCTKTEQGLVIENLSETNPVRVNGREILGPVLLHSGDHIIVGGTHFLYEDEREEEFIEKEEGSKRELVEEEPEEEKRPSETIFREEEIKEEEPLSEILFPSSRFIFKVVAGPNTGAEIALETGKSYLIGTDSVTCDIVFHDLSVSREHARLTISEEGTITIEDLGSRNGVIIEKERISGRVFLTPNRLISLGTSVFLVIDKEAPLETIIAPTFEEVSPKVESEEEELLKEERAAEELEGAPPLATAEEKPTSPPKPSTSLHLPTGPLILMIISLGIIVLLGVGILSLFKSQQVEIKPAEYNENIEKALKQFSGVKFSFIEREGKLLIVGHVATNTEKNELLYSIQKLAFVKAIEDNIIDDEAVSQETNILLSKNGNFQGVTLYAPEPGCFMVTGYLKTFNQLAQLSDFLNLNFNYLSLLKYRVIIEDQVVEEVKTMLLNEGFSNVGIEFSGGLLTLTGYIPSTDMQCYTELVTDFQKITGVRVVRNYVVTVTPEAAVIDLNERYPGRYAVSGLSKQSYQPTAGYPRESFPTQPGITGFPRESMPGAGGGGGMAGARGAGGLGPQEAFPGRYEVTGYTKHCDVNINVVVNGRLLMRGDTIDGMTITSIQPNAIFLERDGLKYKIEYNK